MDEPIPAWPHVNGAMLRIGILFLALVAACTGVKEAPLSPMAQSQPRIVEPSPVEPNLEAAAAKEPSRSEANEEASAVPAPPPAGPRQPAKAVPPPAKASATAAAIPVAIEQPHKHEAPVSVAKTLEPPLDVAALKARLRDTSAIGVFTKLALKNQVDDLLQQFRAHYQSGQKTSVASLRQSYNMLVLKVLSLLQDGDPSLARTISGSREAIWGILADPEKFNSIV